MNIKKIGLGVVLLLLVYLGIILIHGSLTDWTPALRQPLVELQRAKLDTVRDSVITVVTWNMGYAGLGAESDFFYEGSGGLLALGKDVRPAAAVVEKNLAGAEQFVRQTQVDFFLLQEVDSASRRSYFTHQLDSLRAPRPDYAAHYAPNYRVNRVPVPLLEPWRAYGSVASGLLSLARYQPIDGERLQLPGAFGWPKRVFQLDRCVALQRFQTAWGRQLVVINAHLSAHDGDGALKRAEMAYLRELVLREYEAGHYVIVGADWNQVPPYFPYDTFSPGNTQGYTQQSIDAEYLPADWQWVYDPTVASNRKTRTPYDAEQSFTTIIDFFLLSPNMRARQVRLLNQQFQFSDHQPVYLEAELLR